MVERALDLIVVDNVLVLLFCNGYRQVQVVEGDPSRSGVEAYYRVMHEALSEGRASASSLKNMISKIAWTTAKKNDQKTMVQLI